MAQIQLVISHLDELEMDRVRELAGMTYEPSQCLHLVDCPFTHCVLANIPSVTNVGSVIAHIEYPPPHNAGLTRIMNYVMAEYNGNRGALDQLDEAERSQAAWILQTLIYLITLCPNSPHQIQSFFNPEAPDTLMFFLIYQRGLEPLSEEEECE